MSTCLLYGGWWKAGVGGVVLDALLGPEGSGVCLILMANEKLIAAVVVVGVGCGPRLVGVLQEPVGFL